MIVAWDNSWSMLTPSKTGSRSAEKALEDVSYVMTPRHYPFVLPEPTPKRYMLIRSPQARWVSIHMFLLRNDSLWRGSNKTVKPVPEDPNCFVDAFFENKTGLFQRDFFLPLATLHDMWQPHEVFRLEHIVQEGQLLGHPFPKRNVTKTRVDPDSYYSQLSIANMARLLTHFRRDWELCYERK